MAWVWDHSDNSAELAASRAKDEQRDFDRLHGRLCEIAPPPYIPPVLDETEFFADKCGMTRKELLKKINRDYGKSDVCSLTDEEHSDIFWWSCKRIAKQYEYMKNMDNIECP